MFIKENRHAIICFFAHFFVTLQRIAMMAWHEQLTNNENKWKRKHY